MDGGQRYRFSIFIAIIQHRLTVRLCERSDQQLRKEKKKKLSGRRTLVSGTRTRTTELLGLAPAVVGNEQGAVVLDEQLLDVVLGVLIDELLEVGDDGLGDSLTDGVHLRGVTTAGDAHADVDVGELLEADDQERLVDLEPQDLGLDEVQRLAVDLDETLTGLAVGDRGS
jgi:hypothetical protein